MYPPGSSLIPLMRMLPRNNVPRHTYMPSWHSSVQYSRYIRLLFSTFKVDNNSDHRQRQMSNISGLAGALPRACV